MISDVSASFYLHLEVADRPARARADHERSSVDDGISVQSVVQRGLGDDARLVMVLHEAPERLSTRRSTSSAGLDFLRAAPRAIRVVEEVFA